MSNNNRRDRPQKKAEKRKVIIFTEGQKTEPAYLNALKEDKKDELLVNVIVCKKSKCSTHKKRNATNILKEAEKEFEKQEKMPQDSLWIVFDADIGNNTNEALRKVSQEAKRKKIQIAFSNPAFELWFLLHFREIIRDNPIESALSRSDNSKEAKKQLKQHITNYTEGLNVYPEIKDKQDQALIRAENLFNEYHEEDIYPLVQVNSNPVTNIHLLVKEIIPN